MTGIALALLLAGPLEDCAEIPPIPACAALPAGHAEVCEICTLRARQRDCLGDLSKALAGRSEERGEAEALASRLAEAVRERDRAEEGARTRATVAAAVVGLGTAALVGGLAGREPLVAVAGGVAVAAAVIVARW